MKPAVSIQNLVKHYGTTMAVRGIGFQVAESEIFGLLGPNGAGKTTTLECVIGLRRPDAGTISISGIDALAQPAKIREIIGAQLQSTALQDKITPRQALRFFASFYPRHADIEELMVQFNLAEKAGSAFDTLSGGQRQRLAIALALVNEPHVLFLDEPTASLDARSRRELHALIASLKTAGRTIILTTHDIEEAHQLCDRVGIMHHGQLVAVGKPDDLIAASKSLPRVAVKMHRPLTEDQAKSLDGVARTALREDQWQLFTDAVPRTIVALARLAETAQNELLDVQIHRPTLEDVFLELTGTTLAQERET